MKVSRMTALLALATAMMTMPRAADAAAYWPWCSQYYGTHGGGLHNCAYATREQCMATISGIGGICYRNPYFPPYAAAPGRRAKSRRHTDR